MSTTQVSPSRPLAAPPVAAPDAAVRPSPDREEALSSRIRRSTLRRRLLLATDALAVVDLLLGMNSSLKAMEKKES